MLTFPSRNLHTLRLNYAKLGLRMQFLMTVSTSAISALNLKSWSIKFHAYYFTLTESVNCYSNQGFTHEKSNFFILLLNDKVAVVDYSSIDINFKGLIFGFLN